MPLPAVRGAAGRAGRRRELERPPRAALALGAGALPSGASRWRRLCPPRLACQTVPGMARRRGVGRCDAAGGRTLAR
eukprot:11187349-Lingulodinium_polyedra.AAC.1